MSEKILTFAQIQDAKRIAARLHTLHHDALALKEATKGAFIACAPDSLWQFERRNSDLYPIAATARLSESYRVELLLSLTQAHTWPAPQPAALVSLWKELTR